MQIDGEGRFVMDADEEVRTPKDETITGDIGHLLYLNPGLTLSEIIEQLVGTRWIKSPDYVGGVLDEYKKANYITHDETTGQYSMTDSGITSFISGWW